MLSQGHDRVEFFSPGNGTGIETRWSAFKEGGRDPLRALPCHIAAVSLSQFTRAVPMHIYSEEDKGVFENYWASLTLDRVDKATKVQRNQGYHECPREQAMDSEWRTRCAGACRWGPHTHSKGCVIHTAPLNIILGALHGGQSILFGD